MVPVKDAIALLQIMRDENHPCQYYPAIFFYAY